jgi:hypothetical protein
MSSGNTKPELEHIVTVLRKRLELLKKIPSTPQIESDIKKTRDAIHAARLDIMQLSDKPDVESAPATAAAVTDTPEKGITRKDLEVLIIELEDRINVLKNRPKTPETRLELEKLKNRLEHTGQSLSSLTFIEKAIQDGYDETKKEIDMLDMLMGAFSVEDDPIITLSDDIQDLIPLRMFSKDKVKNVHNKDTDTFIDLKKIITDYKSNPRIAQLLPTSNLFTHVNMSLDKLSKNIYFNFVLNDGRRVTVSLHSQKSKSNKGALHIYIKNTTIPYGNVKEPKLHEYRILIEKNVAEKRYTLMLSSTGRDADIEKLYQSILDFIGTYLTLVMNNVSEFFGKKKGPRLSKRQRRKSMCWKGYHRVKGTAPYTKHSCTKNVID